MIVRELLTKLGFAVNESKLTVYAKKTNDIKERANEAANSFRGMLGAFLGISALKSIGTTADIVQSLEARMAQMTQTAGGAGASFDEVSKRATAARQSLSAYATLYIRIGNASQDLIKNQGDLLGIIDTVSQALTVGGVAATEQESAMLQLSQAFNKGKLDGDEFKSVMEAMPPAFTRSLAAAMGYKNGLAEFYEASSDGKLSIESLIAGIQQIGPQISKQFSTMPMTLSQAFVIIGNRYQTFVARMNRESGAVTNIANFFIGAFDKIEIGLNKMVDFLGGSTQALKFFGIVLAAVLTPMIVRTFVGMIMTMLSPVGLLVAGLVLLGLIIEDIYQWMHGGKSLTGDFIGEFAEWEPTFSKIGHAVNFYIIDPFVLLVKIVFELFDIVKKVFGFMIDNPSLILAAMGPIGVLISAIGSAMDKLGISFDTVISKAKSLMGMMPDGSLAMLLPGGAPFAAAGMATSFYNNATAPVNNVTVHQTLPAGTPQETAKAAENATLQVFGGNLDIIGRQMGSYTQ